LMAQLG